jgi:hypothetical protein
VTAGVCIIQYLTNNTYYQILCIILSPCGPATVGTEHIFLTIVNINVEISSLGTLGRKHGGIAGITGFIFSI